jgi:DNA-binding LacI/PurR family transcriptional regulator
MPLLYERLRAHLLDEIRSGRLTAGDRVPSELALAEQFNVSRITSKKALETLERDGLIVRYRGKGSFVAENRSGFGLPPSAGNPGLGNSVSSHQSLVVPTLGYVVPSMSDVYGTRMLDAIEDRCSQLGYGLVLKRTHGEREIEDAAISRFVELGVHGLIIFPIHGEFYNDALLRIVLDGFPVVLVDRYLKGIAVNSVGSNNYEACRALTNVLIDRGIRNIGFFSLPPERTSSIEDRRRGFGAALREAGLPYDRSSLLMSLVCTLPGEILEASIEADRQRVNAYLDAHPEMTGFVACEYPLAIILEQVLIARGQGELVDNITCFDALNSPMEPVRFTHVQQDERKIGETAVDLLTGRVANPNRTPRVDIPFEIVHKG